MSAVNYSIGDNPPYHGETSSGFMESVQNNVTSVTDAIPALSKRVSDQQTALSDQGTALNASAGQLQTLYQSLIDTKASIQSILTSRAAPSSTSMPTTCAIRPSPICRPR
jgi:hypothetical protein